MVRFVIYKNSILASICSMIGAVCIVMAVSGLFGKEIGILPGIVMIAAGFGLMFLASIISERKERKKKAKAAANTTVSPSKASGAGASRAARTASASTAANTAAAKSGTHAKTVKKSAVFAGIFFLLAAALGFWAIKRYCIIELYLSINSEQVMLAGAGLLLAIAAFRTRAIQEVSVLYVLGFLALTFGSADVAMCTYRDYGFGGYHNLLVLAPLASAIAYFLMTLFALFSMRKIKNYLGGITRWLWWLPVLVLIAAFVKWYNDGYIGNAFAKVTYPKWIGLKYLPREFLEAFARMSMILAAFISGICFRRLSKKPIETYVRPEPQSAYTAPAHETPAQPQPKPSNVVYEAPKQTAQPEPCAPKANQQDLQKKLQAYKDLLDCGILTQEEYDQKVRELM